LAVLQPSFNAEAERDESELELVNLKLPQVVSWKDYHIHITSKEWIRTSEGNVSSCEALNLVRHEAGAINVAWG
jgi:hypothetical protein